jgi:ATP-dependent Clp protease ATP-binding subunit ClpC
MKEIVSRMSQLDIKVNITKPAREFLVDKGYDPAFGARPLKRALQKYVEDPIAEEILRNRFGHGSTISVKYNKKTESLKFTEVGKKKKKDDSETEPEQSENKIS